MSETYTWQPATAAQKAALDSPAELLFFGGSAGSLKTETLLMDAVQEYQNPNLRGIIFRASFPEMADVLDKTQRLYPPLGGTYVGSPKWTWTFPSGATIRFGYMKTDEDWRRFLGPRFSFIGWDESTLHSEKQVRNILGRLSSTDKTLRLRCRLASNPGNIGAPWHQEIFLRGHCPIHNPAEAAQPGKLYRDRKWPSDGKPISSSVCFIPGRLSDHSLLDENYVKRLDEMSAAQAAAMRDGCWCTLEGAYFPFLNKSMVKPLADCGIEPWNSHFISIDYGFGQSYAAATLFVRTPPVAHSVVRIPGVKTVEPPPPKHPNGQIRVIAEILVPMTPVDDFARLIVDRFVMASEGEQRRSIVAVFLDPANFNPSHDERVGTAGHAVSDQIDKVFEPWGLVCQRASNNRVGGWQLVHRMLRDGELELTDGCPQTFESLRTRMMDPERSGDIVKIAGDKGDDSSDCARYGAFSWISLAEKPRELILAEAIKGLDLTSAAIRYQQTAEALDRQEAPLRMGTRLGLRR